ncbi:ROK family transcriptional regulator [Gottschalkiaceae bacterium SANA]|nr:ROK family transcriptional regulator [Gottschalkiaceae bacterium SANA]
MNKATSPEVMKLNNKKAILELIYSEKNIYRAQIADRTRLSNQTVTNLVKELKEEGFIKEVTMETKGKGRNPIALSIALDDLCAIGVEISVRGVTVGCFNASGRVICREEHPPTDGILPIVKAMLERALKAADTKTVLGNAISVEGVINESKGLVVKSSVGLEGVNLKEELRYLGIKTYIRNDVNLLAETSDRQEENYMMIRFDRGIGAALFLNGAILRSDHNMAGEFGHAIVYSNPSPKPCKCGKTGCLTTEASMSAIETHFKMSVSDAAAAYHAEEDEVTVKMEQLSRFIAEPLANLITIMDLEKVLVTGTLVDLFGETFLQSIHRAVLERLSVWNSYQGIEVLETYDIAERSAKFVVEKYFLRWRNGGAISKK